MLPPSKIQVATDTVPNFRNTSIAFATETKAARKDAELSVVNAANDTLLYKKKESFKTAPHYRVLPSIGITHVFNSFRRSDATVNNGVVENTPDEDQWRLIAGLHIYPFAGGMVRADDHNIIKLASNKHWKQVASRISLFTAASFPKPLHNLHLGASVDIWTGVKLSGGAHIYRYTSYTLLNNAITKEESNYIYNKGFISLSIDPVSFGKLVGIIN